MNFSYSAPLALAAAAVAVTAAIAVWLLRRRRLTPEQIEVARRLHVHALGRITSGEILDMMPAPEPAGAEAAPTLVYEYEVAGVTYQASQQLHLVPVRLDPQSWIPGLPVQVKYDPVHPGNSMVACEHWVGLGPRARGAEAGSIK
ncbi:MAG: hypothetical protein ACRD04_02855 [Terriglobales bacterium]